MEFSHNVIKQIISDLDKSINIHRLIPVLYPDCTCNNASKTIDKCFKCKSSEVIDDLDCLKSNLEPIAKNTIYHIKFIDVESFCYTLGKSGHIHSIEINPVFSGPNSELPNSEPPIGFTIDVTPTSRYAMDGNGYHVGYESVTYRWIARSKKELGIAGVPHLLSSWVVNPIEYEIESKDLPDEDQLVHDDDCEFSNDPDNFDDCEFSNDPDNFDDCDCADHFNGYYPPDDDFFYQEIESIMSTCNWIEAEFNSDTREWKLGYTSFNVNEYQTNKEYADSCNQDNGMPSFGNYLA